MFDVMTKNLKMFVSKLLGWNDIIFYIQATFLAFGFVLMVFQLFYPQSFFRFMLIQITFNLKSLFHIRLEIVFIQFSTYVAPKSEGVWMEKKNPKKHL